MIPLPTISACWVEVCVVFHGAIVRQHVVKRVLVGDGANPDSGTRYVETSVFRSSDGVDSTVTVSQLY